MREMEPLVHAQVAQALGISCLVLRDRRTGQFIKRLNAGALQRHLTQGDPVPGKRWDDLSPTLRLPSSHAAHC